MSGATLNVTTGFVLGLIRLLKGVFLRSALYRASSICTQHTDNEYGTRTLFGHVYRIHVSAGMHKTHPHCASAIFGDCSPFCLHSCPHSHPTSCIHPVIQLSDPPGDP